MSSHRRCRVIVLASHLDGEDVGESYNAYKWVKLLSEHCDIVLLTQYGSNQKRPSEQLPGVEVIEWPEMPLFARFERFNAMAKPDYPHYYFKVRANIRSLLGSGRKFDLVHHLTPIAIRYPTPCTGLGLPYIVGPLSGGVSTPPGFEQELNSNPAFMKLRALDRLRLRLDPLLRRSFAQADLVLGAAPYIETILSAIPLRRFEIECEVGIDEPEPAPVDRKASGAALRLLYVGRVIRTKGLKDAVRAMSHLPGELPVTLTAAGDGPDLQACRQMAEDLNVAERITFLGRVDRQAVEQLYRSHDAFIFPSFREPTGGVVLEAMRHGLPVISSNIGGPGYIVTDDCGIRVVARNPEQFAGGLAEAVMSLAASPQRREALGEGARARVVEIGLWSSKIKRMLDRYENVIERCGAIPP